MEQSSGQSEGHQVLEFAVRKFLEREEIMEGGEVEIRIFVTNVSNNPIHEYRIERAG